MLKIYFIAPRIRGIVAQKDVEIVVGKLAQRLGVDKGIVRGIDTVRATLDDVSKRIGSKDMVECFGCRL